MSRGKKILIGVIIIIVLLCGAFMLFVNWTNSEEGQAAMNEVGTKQAIESATAAVEATAQAQANANANATATANMETIDERMQNLTLVYENTFDEGKPILTPNGNDVEPYYRDGIPEVIVPWNGSVILPAGQTFTDFVAEVDCMTNGTFCGIAYNISNNSDKQQYFASGIGNAEKFFFTDIYSHFSSTNWDGANFPPSPAASFLNRVRVERFGQVMRFYVNGELMEERILNDPAPVPGDVGFYFGKASDDSGIQTVQFDNFRVWQIP